MTRQELDNLIFASGIIYSIQTVEERYGISKALQTAYDVIAMIIKDNSEELNKTIETITVEVK